MPGLLQIITPPVSSALTTLKTAKDDLNQADSYADDSYITKLIDRASSAVSAYCGRTLGKRTVSETCRISGQMSNTYLQAVGAFGTPLLNNAYKPLVLSQLPVVSITSVTERTTTLSSSDYEYDAESGMIWRLYAGLRSAWVNPVTTVTYVGGYTLPNDGTSTLPAVIEEVTLSLTRGAYFARGGDPKLMMEIVEGVGRNTYQQTASMSGMQIDENSASLLARYVART